MSKPPYHKITPTTSQQYAIAANNGIALTPTQAKNMKRVKQKLALELQSNMINDPYQEPTSKDYDTIRGFYQRCKRTRHTERTWIIQE